MGDVWTAPELERIQFCTWRAGIVFLFLILETSFQKKLQFNYPQHMHTLIVIWRWSHSFFSIWRFLQDSACFSNIFNKLKMSYWYFFLKRTLFLICQSWKEDFSIFTRPLNKKFLVLIFKTHSQCRLLLVCDGGLNKHCHSLVIKCHQVLWNMKSWKDSYDQKLLYAFRNISPIQRTTGREPAA